MRYRAKIVSARDGTTVLESEVEVPDDAAARRQIEAAALLMCNYPLQPGDRTLVDRLSEH